MPKRTATEAGLTKRQKRVKSEARSRAGRERWNRLTAEEKEAVLARLQGGRGRHRHGPPRAVIKRQRRQLVETEGLALNQRLHQSFIDNDVSKREARRIIQNLRIDLGLIKNKRKRAHTPTGLPPLHNPLPDFFGKAFDFFKRRTQQHFEGLFRYWEPLVHGLGIVPPNIPIFDHLLNQLLHI